MRSHVCERPEPSIIRCIRVHSVDKADARNAVVKASPIPRKGLLAERPFAEREPGVGLGPLNFTSISLDGKAIKESQVVPPRADVLQALRRHLQATEGAVVRQPLTEDAKLPLREDKPLTAPLLEKEPQIRLEPGFLEVPVEVVKKPLVGNLNADLIFRREPGDGMRANPFGDSLIRPDGAFRLPSKEKDLIAAHAVEVGL